MLKRKITAYLEKWLERDTVLLVDGARQTGKSFSINEFGNRIFGVNFFGFNFDEHRDLIEDFNKIKTAQELITNLSYYASKPFEVGKTLIFLDEVQLISEIDWQMFAKYLVSDGRYRFILSGSLLGVTLNNIVKSPNAYKNTMVGSHPGGYLDEYRMYPLDFEEYLWANGLAQENIDMIKKCFYEKREVDFLPHKRLMDLFYEYLFVGGMPNAVDSYLRNHDLQDLRLAHERIEAMNHRDIIQYAQANDRLHLLEVYESLSSQINNKNKRFTLNTISKSNSYEISDDFNWLIKAGIAYPVYNVTAPETPLRLNEKRRLVKLFEGDVGMLCFHLMDTGTIKKILAKDKDINFGAIFENVAAQLMACHGFENMWYYNNKKHGEMDLLIEYEGKIIPIEIKSGKDYKRHSALSYFMSDRNDYQFDEAFVFNSNNYSREGKLHYFPIYMIEFLRRY